MAGGRSSAPSCVGLRSAARRSRSCSASQARLFRPAAALSPPQTRTKEASYPRFGTIVGGACHPAGGRTPGAFDPHPIRTRLAHHDLGEVRDYVGLVVADGVVDLVKELLLAG